MSDNHLLVQRHKAATQTNTNSANATPHPTLPTAPKTVEPQTKPSPPQAVTEPTSVQQMQADDIQQETPQLQAQLERAKRFGHNLNRISLDRPEAKLTDSQPGDDWVQRRLIQQVASPQQTVNQTPQVDRLARFDRHLSVHLPSSAYPAVIQRQLTHVVQQTGGVQALDGAQVGSHAPTKAVEAIVVDVIKSLQTDPEDRSRQVRRRLGSLEPSTREAVLTQVQAHIQPEQWQRLSQILAESTHASDEPPLPETDPVAASQAAAKQENPTAQANGSSADGLDKLHSLPPKAEGKGDVPLQSHSGETASGVTAHSNVHVPGKDVDKTAGESDKSAHSNKHQPGGEAIESEASHAQSGGSNTTHHHLLPDTTGQADHSDGATHQHPGDVANSGLSPTATQGSPPAMPESPVLSQAAQQIIKTTAVEKAALSQTAQAQRTTVIQQAETKVHAIEAASQSKIKAIIAAVESKKAGVKQSFSTTKATVKGQIESHKAAAQADGAKALSTLHKEVENKRKAAIDAAEDHAKQIEQAGQTEALRASTSSAESANRVNATANQKINSYSGNPKVQAAVRQAIGQAAPEVVGKMRQRGQDLAKNATEASQKTAKGFRDAGKQLAAGAGNNTAKVEQAIQEGTKATVNRVAAQGTLQLQKLDALKAQALASLEKLKAASIPGIRQAGKSAASSARKAGHAVGAQIDRTKAATLKQFDKGAHAAVNHLHQVPKGRKLNNKAVQEFAQDTGEKLRQARVELGTAISSQAKGGQTSLNQLGVAFSGHLDRAHHKVTAETNKAAASLNSGLAQVPGQAAQSSQQAITEGRIANQKAVQQFGDGLQQKIDGAKQGWGKEQQKVHNDIRGKVDQGIKSDQDVENKAPADFTQLAQTAATKAQESLLSQIGSGIWEGIKSVAKGLLILAAVVIVVTLAVMLVAAIAGVAVVFSEVLLAVVAIVGICFMIYSFITAMIKRSDDFWKSYGTDLPWYKQVLGFFAVFAVAVGDVFGVSPIIEGIVGKEAFTGKELTPEQRAEKITEGVLTIALMFLFGKLLKGLEKPGEVPGKDPVDPGKGKDPVDPGKGKDPVDPGKTDTAKELGEKVGKENADRIIQELGEDGAKKLVQDLGPDVVKKLLQDLSPREIQNFVNELGAEKVKALSQKFSGDVLKHYGPEFFKTYKGVTQDTINHLLQNDGIVKGEIKGCHDKATFLSELNGKGEVVSETSDPSNSDVTRYEYKLYQKDNAGNIKQPPTLSTGKPKLKTVIDGLASNPDKWKNIGNDAADDAINRKAFPASGGAFEGTGQGTKIRGFYRGDKVDTFFPDF